MSEKKLCPFAKVDEVSTRVGEDGIERGTLRPVFSRCIGKECMMWREAREYSDGTRVIAHCGLAGKP